MFQRAPALAVMALASVMQATPATAFDLAPGNIYSTQGRTSYNLRSINEYDPSGKLIGTLHVPGTNGTDLNGLGFGADGMLYTIRSENDCQHVTLVQIDTYGIARDFYSWTDSCAGHANASQIAAAQNGDLYIAGNLGLVAVNTVTGDSYRIVPSTDIRGSVIGVAVLPSGNLLVANSTSIWEMSTDGIVVRRLAADKFFVDIQSLAYDADADLVFVSALGYFPPDSADLKLTVLDGTTGDVLNHIMLYNPGVLALTPHKNLVVTNRNSIAQIYDEDLNLRGTLQNSTDQVFVAAMPNYSDSSTCYPYPQIACAIYPTSIGQPPRR